MTGAGEIRVIVGPLSKILVAGECLPMLGGKHGKFPLSRGLKNQVKKRLVAVGHRAQNEFRRSEARQFRDGKIPSSAIMMFTTRYGCRFEWA